MAVELLHVKLGPLPQSTPNDGAALLMNFEHVFLRGLAVKTEDALKDHGDVAHEVNRIVVDYNLPGQIDLLLFLRLLLDDWRFGGR